MCVCVFCLIVVLLPPGKNPLEGKINNNNNNNNVYKYFYGDKPLLRTPTVQLLKNQQFMERSLSCS
jgi:hypothetical protein